MLSKAEIARLRSLQDKKHRDALGIFVVEGEKVVTELLREGFPLLEVYSTPDWAPPTRRSGATTFHLVTHNEMARVSHYPTPASVIAVGRLERSSLAPEELNQGLTLALDGIQDAGNLGTLLRIADWYALKRVVCSLDCVDLYNQKVINASMGSFSRVPVYTHDLDRALQGVRVPILGCDLEGDSVHALTPLKDAIVVVGSEGRGLSAPVKARLSRRITIPRFGRAESLNAGIAAAIVCDNLRRGSSS